MQSLSILQETKNLFQAYVGAVFVQKGPNETLNWTTNLIDPEYVTHTDSPVGGYTRESKRMREEPLPPATTPPPVPPVVVQALNNGANGNARTFLQIFNERCSQRHVKCEYKSENLGAPHVPIWHVNCFG